MRTLIKWAGGKTSELQIIKQHMPEKFDRVIEPFVGGGAVFLGLESQQSIVNDFSQELIRFYEIIKSNEFEQFKAILVQLHEERLKALNLEVNDSFLDVASKINNHPSFEKFLHRELKSKLARIDKLNHIRCSMGDSPLSHEEMAVQYHTAVTAALYYVWREIYNESHQLQALDVNHIAHWYAIKQFAFSGMTRYSETGNFNVPYAGISYDSRSLIHNLEAMQSAHDSVFFQNTEFQSGDFENLFTKFNYFSENDFIFIDPPYDDGFSKYNSEGDFTREDQIRLRDVLLKCKGKVMVLVKETDFISSLYGEYFNITRFDKNYSVNMKNRNQQGVQHLLITNY
ncbi:DNA adenine methylase [Pseudomonas amygdali pv. eriobotryae]|uniref:site-specific DNA-methyltransferase (adenine-specific) n=1 Tax=Pseudomonas amygdali pv. eriobotryae TaxID=129137 RepID=A0A9P3ECF2_PSEA0|nr:DNA adenine methylase [Pseudomonas amygdali]GFZ59407.1 DNA adenine methylase [Pseudomonas amygdali pv. eriobotryae]